MQFLQGMVSGISQGCIYGLIALDFVLIYKATEAVSFAQGELMMLGGFCGLALMTVLGFPYWLAVPATIVAMGLFGVVLECLGSNLSRISQIQHCKWKVVSDYVQP